MERLINDLDNNLVREEATVEVFSNLTKGGTKTLGEKTLTLQSGSASAGSVITQPTLEPTPAPRNGSSEGATTMPVGEAIPIEEGMPTGGGMGFPAGGGGMPPAEEEVPSEAARMGDNKILGLDPRLFYGLLIVAGIGGYLYFRKGKAVKAK